MGDRDRVSEQRLAVRLRIDWTADSRGDVVFLMPRKHNTLCGNVGLEFCENTDMAGKVFINYRRAESLKDARHLASLLDKGALKGRIFIDTKGLDGAPDWLTELERQVASSDVMISLICKDWTDIRDAEGKRRIDDENDFVRFELAEAFRRKIPVVPVLVDGASMPRGDRLPPNMLLLTRPQAELLRSESFDADVLKIGRRVQAEIAERRKALRVSVPVWVTVAAALAALSVGLAAGPTLMEKLGLAIPMAAERIGALERNLADHRAKLDEARGERTNAEARLIAAQFQVKQLTAEREAALRDAKRLMDELAAAKSNAASQKANYDGMKASYDSVRAQLNGAIKKYYGPCPGLGDYRFIYSDGSSECRAGLLAPRF
jgi:hypothetical protein